MSNYFALESAALQSELKLVQAAYDSFMQKNLKLDMSRGKPAPNQLDLSAGLLEETDYMDEKGVDTRNYGNIDGTPEAKCFFAELLGITPEETFVGGNSSLNSMYNLIEMGWRIGFPQSSKPWKDCGTIKFLCPSPGYDRHFKITEAFGFELITVPMTPDGPDMDAVEQLVKDEAVKGIWCIPIYSNPDGYVYSDETVQRLATMQTAAADFRIFWDNAYLVHHLVENPAICPNLLEECRKAGTEDRALMFCSTSKITFAGAGVCAIGASVNNIKAIINFFSPMTIGYDKLNQLRHVRFLKNAEGVAAHMKKHAALIAPKFKAVLDTLETELGSCGKIAHWTKPNGGYFISLFVMNGCAKRVVELCKQAGVVLTGAGAAYPYGVDPDDSHIRIAPTYPSSEELALAAQLLCIATRLASLEKLLAK